jgi:queuine tRNA-ribosyltransferase
MGGLHKFMGWDKTDPDRLGGFEVFSLPDKTITDEGVTSRQRTRRSSPTFLDPETSTAIQRDLGADIVMAFDERCPPDASKAYVAKSIGAHDALGRRRSASHLAPHRGLFGIVQGGMFDDLPQGITPNAPDRRSRFDGFAIGGVSVGEPRLRQCS